MSSVEVVLDRAAGAERARLALVADQAAWRLSADAFLDRALELASCGRQRCREIEAVISTRKLAYLSRYIDGIASWYKRNRMAEPSLRGLRALASDLSDREAAVCQATDGELLAAAIARLVEHSPDWFGVAGEPGEAQLKHDALVIRRDRALAQLAGAVRLSDLQITSAGGDLIRVVLKMTGTPVGAPGWELRACEAWLARAVPAEAA